MRMIERVSAVVLAIALLITLSILKRQQNGGPPQMDFDLPGNQPATLFLPGPSGGFFYEAVGLTPPPADKRSPAVVLAHGYSADRLLMGELARRIAQNGYIVLSFDFHGHGENRNPFSRGFAEHDVLQDDLKAAVDYLRN